jgi:hypothetical protein
MEEVRALGYDALSRLVNQKVISEPVQINNGDVWIDVEVIWADERRRTLHVWGTAWGPNWQQLERIDEKILLAPQSSTPTPSSRA